MTLKEIALELAEKYEDAEESRIWEYSGRIEEDEEELRLEIENYKKKIESFAERQCESVPMWIPVSKRLPNKNCRCLTTNEENGAFDVDWNVWMNGEWLFPNETPTAWMPFPKPWEGKD